MALLEEQGILQVPTGVGKGRIMGEILWRHILPNIIVTFTR